MTTLEKLREIRERADKATSVDKWKDAGSWFHDHRVGYPLHKSGENDEEDAEFIAHSRSDIPALVEALECTIEALKYVTSVRGRKCQDEQCTCAYDAAHIAITKIEQIMTGEK